MIRKFPFYAGWFYIIALALYSIGLVCLSYISCVNYEVGENYGIENLFIVWIPFFWIQAFFATFISWTTYKRIFQTQDLFNIFTGPVLYSIVSFFLMMGVTIPMRILFFSYANSDFDKGLTALRLFSGILLIAAIMIPGLNFSLGASPKSKDSGPMV